jgi:hypothetical protein
MNIQTVFKNPTAIPGNHSQNTACPYAMANLSSTFHNLLQGFFYQSLGFKEETGQSDNLMCINQYSLAKNYNLHCVQSLTCVFYVYNGLHQ